ncbi:MAG: PadR family transcriptional regulator [Frondihabitans sp.]|nr:PadR family transcriptional regulator [Frondihabitans sp.]
MTPRLPARNPASSWVASDLVQGQPAIEFREIQVDHPDAEKLLREYFAERIATFPDPAGYTTTLPESARFVPPEGVFLVAVGDGEDDGADDEIIGGGGIRRLSSERYEVKHLFVRPAGRGRGLGKALLGELERRARAFGAIEVVLDTNDSLTAAGGLYRSAGYRTIEPYNDNPNATTWYWKSLTTR